MNILLPNRYNSQRRFSSLSQLFILNQIKTIQETKKIEHLTDAEIAGIFHLTKPFYIDSSNVVARELKHNDTIYLLKDNSSTIVSFFMVNWEKHTIQQRDKDVVYLGLSCAAQNHQEKHLASKVYYHFTKDAFSYEEETGEKLMLYGTTATPVVLLTLSKIWDDVKPETDGSYSHSDKVLIEDIKRSSGLDKFSSDHPFVLKGIATDTKYAVAEETRLKEFQIKHSIKIFKTLKINEANGDRLLITCKVPGKTKLDILRTKLFGQ